MMRFRHNSNARETAMTNIRHAIAAVALLLAGCASDQMPEPTSQIRTGAIVKPAAPAAPKKVAAATPVANDAPGSALWCSNRHAAYQAGKSTETPEQKFKNDLKCSFQ
jgi:hypothetical protein